MAFETREDEDVAEAAGVRRADVVFVLDTTGSMAESIGAVKNCINEVAEVFLQSKILIRLSLIEFRDRLEAQRDMGRPEFELKEGGGTLPTLRVVNFKTDEQDSSETFTRDFDAFQSAVEELVAEGGGPLEESSLDALAKASRSEWKDGATRILILLTDAPPNLPDYEMKSVVKTAHELSAGGVDQLFILCPLLLADDYRDLARARTTREGPIMWQFFPLEAHSDSSQIVDSLLQVATSSSTSISASESEGEEVPTVVFNDDDDGEELDGNPFLI